jgi:hypothetical protein
MKGSYNERKVKEAKYIFWFIHGVLPAMWLMMVVAESI